MLVMVIDETSEFSHLLEQDYLKGKPYHILDEAKAAAISRLCANQKNIEQLDAEVLSLCAPRAVGSTVSDQRIVDVLRVIKESESVGESMLSDLCNIACLSRSRLSHLFREQVRTSLASYFVIAKMEKACRYVIRGENLTTAAIHAGFNSPSHFSATCKRLFGISLSDFLQR